MTHQPTEIETHESIPMNSFRMRIMEGEGYCNNHGDYSRLLHEAAKLEDALYNMILAVRFLQKENDALLKKNDELRQENRELQNVLPDLHS